LALAIAAAIAWYWYYSHRHQLRIDVFANNGDQARLEGDPTGLSVAALTYYAKNLLDVQVYLVPVLLLAVGVWRAVVRRSHGLMLLLALLVGTYGFFSLVSNKDARYTLPFMAAVAVLATFWTGELPQRWRAWAQGAVAAYAAVTFWAMSFGMPGLPAAVMVANGAAPVTLWAQHGYIIGPPTHEDWHLEEALRLAQHSTLVYGGPDTVWLNSWGIAYYAAKYGVELAPSPTAAKFVLLRTEDDETDPTMGAVAQHHRLPDGTYLTLYRRD
jgi:hypothetical protein